MHSEDENILHFCKNPSSFLITVGNKGRGFFTTSGIVDLSLRKLATVDADW
jgi:hypothetical protein